MTILQLLVLLLVLGFFGWLAMKLPGESTIRTLILGVLIVIAGLAVLQAFGLLDVLRQPVPRLGR